MVLQLRYQTWPNGKHQASQCPTVSLAARILPQYQIVMIEVGTASQLVCIAVGDYLFAVRMNYVQQFPTTCGKKRASTTSEASSLCPFI